MLIIKIIMIITAIMTPLSLAQVIAGLVALAVADTRDVYRAPAAPQPSYSAPSSSEEGCDEGFVRKADGNCVRPVVTRNLYLYNAPQQRVTYGPAPYIPDPKVSEIFYAALSTSLISAFQKTLNYDESKHILRKLLYLILIIILKNSPNAIYVLEFKQK